MSTSHVQPHLNERGGSLQPACFSEHVASHRNDPPRDLQLGEIPMPIPPTGQSQLVAWRKYPAAFSGWSLRSRLIAIVLALAVPLNFVIVGIIWSLAKAAEDAFNLLDRVADTVGGAGAGSPAQYAPRSRLT